jgi:hypothetical protein
VVILAGALASELQMMLMTEEASNSKQGHCSLHEVCHMLTEQVSPSGWQRETAGSHWVMITLIDSLNMR